MSDEKEWSNELMHIEDEFEQEVREELRQRLERRIQERLKANEQSMEEVARLKKKGPSNCT